MEEGSESNQAMVVEGDVISTLLARSNASDEKMEELSPEDAAWVDSCLMKDSELTDDSWSALRYALLETLDTQVTFYETVDSLVTADIYEVEDEECVQVDEEAETIQIHGEEHFLSYNQQEGDVDVNGEAIVDPQEEIEPLEHIFRVWDLHTPEEEDELIQQLKKALAESKLRVLPPPPHDPKTALNEQQLDELVMNMTDLSLKPL